MSIVDFLNERDINSSFDNRKLLWQQFDPSEVYTGSASQNTRLLQHYEFGEVVPSLRIVNAVVNEGDQVQAVVQSTTNVTIENSFGAMSFDADANETVDLGVVNKVGIFPIRVLNGLIESESALVVIQGDSIGTFHVGIWEGLYELESAPSTIAPDAGDENLFLKFFDAVDQDLIEQAALAALNDTLAPENWLGLGLDVFIGITVTIVAPGVGAGYASEQRDFTWLISHSTF